MPNPASTLAPDPVRGRRILVTQRDFQVLDTLHHYQLAREATLHALHYPEVRHQRNVQSSLKRLCDAGYVGRRFLPPVHRLNTSFVDYARPDTGGAVYFLARDGAAFLGRSHNPNAARVGVQFLQHRLDISDVRACVELACRQAPSISLAWWFGENDRDQDGSFILHDRVKVQDSGTGRERVLPVRPDACFGLQEAATGRQECFFVEVDEGTESGQKRWRDKVAAYRAHAAQGFQRFSFNGKGFRVLTINRSQTNRRPEERTDNLVRHTYEAGGRKQFWFAPAAALMPENRATGDQVLAAPIWTRAHPHDNGQPVALRDHLFDADRKRPVLQ